MKNLSLNFRIVQNRCREHSFFSQKHPCCSLIPPGVSWACQHWHCTFSTLHTQCFDVAAPAEAGEHKFARPHALPTLPAHVMPTFSAMLGVLAATLLLLVFVWGAAGWCSDVTQAQSVGVPFVGGHAHNSEQSCRLEGALEQGDYCSSCQTSISASWKSRSLHRTPWADRTA